MNSLMASAAREIFLDSVVAISVGVLEREVRLDLDYREDSVAGVDMNLVITGRGRFIEVQGTGENTSFTQEELSGKLEAGRAGIARLTELQRAVLGADWPLKR